jgi:HEAT repeat protein
MRIVENLPTKFVTPPIVGALKLMARDPVPNVRMHAAKAVAAHVKGLPELVPVLQELRKDTDPDVRAFVG